MNIDVNAYVYTAVQETDNENQKCITCGYSKPATHSIGVLISTLPGLSGGAIARIYLCDNCTTKFMTAALTPKPEEPKNDTGE